MNRISKSIRWRLQVFHGLILVVVLSAFCFTAYLLARENRMHSIDQELQQTALNLRENPFGRRFGGGGRGGPGPRPTFGGKPPRFEDRPPPREEHTHDDRGRTRDDFPRSPMGGPPMGPPPGIPAPSVPEPFYFSIWSPSGSLIDKSTNAPAGIPISGSAESSQSFRMRGEFRELVDLKRSGFTLVVGRMVSAELAELRRLRWLLAGAGGGVLTLGLLSGWWLASRAIQPIADISATARQIAAGDLEKRISVADTDSELGQLAQVLNGTFARLQAAFGKQAQFTADASHELRTPVSVVLTQTQTTLARERTPSEYRDCLEACQRAAQRMRQLIESLLLLARLDSGDPNSDRQVCNLSAIAADVVHLLKPIADEKNVSISTQLKPSACLGESGHLAQALTNLLSNAIHYNRPGGQVRITVEPAGDLVRAVVADDGIGIAEEDQSKIFDRFYRADKSRSRAQGRTGLGLAITKEIIESHQGRILVASQLGKGSTFTVELPATKESGANDVKQAGIST